MKHELTPYGGIVYDLTDKLSAYASYTEIFLPQSERDINGQQLDPIVGESYETGLKAEFFDGRLNASAAIFKIKQDGFGQSTGVVIPNTLRECAYEASEGPPARASNWRLSGEVAEGWSVVAGYIKFEIRDAVGDDDHTCYPTNLLRTFITYRLPGAFNKLTIGGGSELAGQDLRLRDQPGRQCGEDRAGGLCAA